MASRERRSEVIELVAHERDLAGDKTHLSDRLLQDLGMDGDDAVDFFEQVHERFGTNLDRLYEHWNAHFAPEGFSCWYGLVMVFAGIIGGAITGLTSLSSNWGFAIVVALLVVLYWGTKRWGPPDNMVAITVEDVVAAVEAGSWPGGRERGIADGSDSEAHLSSG